jgi:transposase-like protein
VTRRSLISTLPDLSSEELEAMDLDDRRLEAWMAVMAGATQKSVAERFGVSPTTIRNWLDATAAQRRTRNQDIDLEVERMVGQMEAVVGEAWKRLEHLPHNSMAGPSYLKTVIEAVQVVARLRGIDGKAAATGGTTKSTTVVVRFGGAAGGGKEPERPVIDVAVQERESA